MSQVESGVAPQLQQDLPEQSRTGGALWLLLLLAITVVVWWMARQGRSDALEPAPLPVASATALPAPVDEEEAAIATPARTSARAVEHAPARDSAPSLIASSRIMPKYPASALRAGETGVVMIAATIDTDGLPIDVAIDDRSGNRDLDRAAVAAVKQWRFEPAMRNGKPVQGTVRVPVQFTLDQG